MCEQPWFVPFGILLLACGPVGAQSNPAVVNYPDHSNLLIVRDAQGAERPVTNPAEWAQRVEDIKANVQLVMGPVPDGSRRVPLEMETVARESTEKYLRHKILFTPEPDDRVPAWLLIPKDIPAGQTLSLIHI